VNHQVEKIEKFETAGPFDTDQIPLILTPKYPRKYQEPTRMSSRYKRLFTSRNMERGASMVEYALLLVLIAIISFVAVRVAGENVSTAFSSVADGFTTN
jgi:Flp pilus assembly pilin Flp